MMLLDFMFQEKVYRHVQDNGVSTETCHRKIFPLLYRATSDIRF